MAERNLDLWRPNQLQVILFPVDSPINMGMDQTWWHQITGQEPAETIRKRHEATVIGPHNADNLVLNLDPLRIMWTLAPRIDPRDLPVTMPTLGQYSVSRDRLIGLIRNWIAISCPPIKRMAFTGLLLQDAESHQAAYQLLQLYLPSVRIDPDSTDFQYRVNRRKRSESWPELTHNRLSTWGAGKFIVSTQAQLPGTEMSTSRVEVATAHYTAMLQFDISTDADRIEAIPRGLLGGLFAELIGLANEIAERGDIQ
jgi:hypothetical protein